MIANASWAAFRGLICQKKAEVSNIKLLMGVEKTVPVCGTRTGLSWLLKVPIDPFAFADSDLGGTLRNWRFVFSSGRVLEQSNRLPTDPKVICQHNLCIEMLLDNGRYLLHILYNVIVARLHQVGSGFMM